MIKSLITLIILKSIYILSLPSYEVYPEEPIIHNIVSGESFPLVVKIKENLIDSLTIECSQNISFKYVGRDTIYKTKYGNRIIFEKGAIANDNKILECSTNVDLENVKISIVVNDETTDQTIQFVKKYVVTPSISYSKSTKENDSISLDITLYEQNYHFINVYDHTFLLNGETDKTSLIDCDQIPKAKERETLKIICCLNSTVNKGLYKLERNNNGKLEGMEPFVYGTIQLNSKYLNIFLIYIIFLLFL